jgi:hypothetical protein
MRGCWRKARPRVSTFGRWTEETGSLVEVVRSCDGRFRRSCGGIAPRKASVVEALAKEDNVSNGVVYSENDLENGSVYMTDVHHSQGLPK